MQITAGREEYMSILDASISDILSSLSSRHITSVELVVRYIRRISIYDAGGIKLSAIPILNASVFEEAAASDARRAMGTPPRPLEGIPFLVKDNMKVKGMTVAAGSPAFENLVATDDATCVKQLRAAGAVVLGRTNMPAMANGGMQRGCYGRAESPYNLNYLTAAYASGSSNGSATATAAGFAAFSLGTETVSSGRSPASNNSLVAYTPSRGLLSLEGVFPLYPTCDVLVPLTRTMDDMLRVLDILAVNVSKTTGDFWNEQPFIPLPTADQTRPDSFVGLKDEQSLRGKRLGIPSMYLEAKDSASMSIRPSMVKLWQSAKQSLESCGATVVEVDFPLVTTYEDCDPTTDKWANIDGLPERWLKTERCELIAHVWDDFLIANGQSDCQSLSQVDPHMIFPLEPGTLQGKDEADNQLSWLDLVNYPSKKPVSMFELPGMEQGLQALEHARNQTLEDWMENKNLDAVVFPANGDVGPSNADVDSEGSRLAWRNGVLYSNGNLAIRHLGVPTVSIPMGTMDDTKMPVNLTFAGKAYDDNSLLKFGYAFEAATRNRQKPPLVPALNSDFIDLEPAAQTYGGDSAKLALPSMTVSMRSKEIRGPQVHLQVQGTVDLKNSDLQDMSCYVNGVSQKVSVDDKNWKIEVCYPVSAREMPWKRWTSPLLVRTVCVVVCRTTTGLSAAELVIL